MVAMGLGLQREYQKRDVLTRGNKGLRRSGAQQDSTGQDAQADMPVSAHPRLLVPVGALGKKTLSMRGGSVYNRLP